MGLLGDKYRRLAKEQGEAAQVVLGKADLDDLNTKFQMGIMAHLKATLYDCVSDIADAIESQQQQESTPESARQLFNQRMRLAAIEGDQETIDVLLKEETDRLIANGT